MFDVLTYLGHSALCLAALYIIYKAAMSYETLHRLNRVVLLGIVALSALLPLCEIKIKEEVEWVECNNFYLPDAQSISTAEMVAAEAEPFDYVGLLKSVALGVFLLGVAFMVVRLVMSTLSVWRLIRSGRVERLEDGVTLTVVDNLASPFSYFGHIVVAESDLAENRDLILEHELAHIRLHHSWDVLAVDLALIVWWFNPALWLLRRELQSLHEYQADDSVLRRGVDAKTYQLLLIKRAVGSRLYSIANCLNHSNLKNRITMMCKKKSSRWSAAKLLFVLPLVALSLAATATTVYVTVDNIDESKVKQKSENNQTQSRIEERTFDTEVVKDDKFALSPAGSERYNLVPAEANVATQQSEKREIKGKVVDEQGKPIGGVFVLIKNKPFGAATDSEGNFGGLKVTDGDYLDISHVGYERQEVAVKGNSSFVITLKEKVYTEEQVVVTGFHAGYNPDKKKQTENSSTQEVATIKVVSNNEYLYNGKAYDQIGLAKVLESYNNEAINVQVGENAHYTPILDEILRRVVKRVNYQRVNTQKVVDDIELQASIINYFHRAMRSLRNDECAVGVVYVDLTVGRTGVVTIKKTSAQSKSAEVASYLQKKVEFRLKQYPMVLIDEKIDEPQSVRLEIAFAKRENGELVMPNVNLGMDSFTIVGGEPLQQAAKSTTSESPNNNQSKTSSAKVENDDQPLLGAENMPKFEGGDLNKFRNWVQARLKYPKYAQENVITGRVIVDVIIEKDGTLTVAGFKQSAHESLAAEVERVVKTSPKWEPGSINGKPVRVQFSVPFNFQIRNGLTSDKEDQPLMKAEVLPSFQGGNLANYRSWVESQVVYPKKLLREKIEGRVTAEFIIDKDGSVVFSKILQSPHELFSAEVERVIKSSPKWSPGKQRGEPVMVKMQLPVEFTAPQKSRK